MTKKQILALSIILGILALGIFLKMRVRSAGDSEQISLSMGSAVAGFDREKVERILIGKGASAAPVELVREQGVWKVKSLWNAPANPVKVEKFLRQFSSVRGELRGTGKGLFKDFGMEDTDSFSIRCLGAGDRSLLDLRMGTKQAGAEGSFIRKAASEDIYFSDLDPAGALGIYTDLETAQPVSGAWADLRLFHLDPEKVKKIAVFLLKGDEKTMITGLERETDPEDPLKSSWKFLRQDNNLSPDPGKAVRFIATMNSVRAEKVVDPALKKYGLGEPVWQLVVTEDDQEKVLNAGPKDAEEDLYYVKMSGSATVFSLAGSYFGDLNVDDTHFVKEVAPVTAAKKEV